MTAIIINEIKPDTIDLLLDFSEKIKNKNNDPLFTLKINNCIFLISSITIVNNAPTIAIAAHIGDDSDAIDTLNEICQESSAKYNTIYVSHQGIILSGKGNFGHTDLINLSVYWKIQRNTCDYCMFYNNRSYGCEVTGSRRVRHFSDIACEKFKGDATTKNKS